MAVGSFLPRDPTLLDFRRCRLLIYAVMTFFTTKTRSHPPLPAFRFPGWVGQEDLRLLFFNRLLSGEVTLWSPQISVLSPLKKGTNYISGGPNPLPLPPGLQGKICTQDAKFFLCFLGCCLFTELLLSLSFLRFERCNGVLVRPNWPFSSDLPSFPRTFGKAAPGNAFGCFLASGDGIPLCRPPPGFFSRFIAPPLGFSTFLRRQRAFLVSLSKLKWNKHNPVWTSPLRLCSQRSQRFSFPLRKRGPG